MYSFEEIQDFASERLEGDEVINKAFLGFSDYSYPTFLKDVKGTMIHRLLIATDRRIVIYTKRAFDDHFFAYTYNEVIRIEPHEQTVGMGATVYVKDEIYKIKDILVGDGLDLVDYVNTRVHEVREKVS